MLMLSLPLIAAIACSPGDMWAMDLLQPLEQSKWKTLEPMPGFVGDKSSIVARDGAVYLLGVQAG